MFKVDWYEYFDLGLLTITTTAKALDDQEYPMPHCWCRF